MVGLLVFLNFPFPDAQSAPRVMHQNKAGISDASSEDTTGRITDTDRIWFCSRVVQKLLWEKLLVFTTTKLSLELLIICITN